MHSSNCRKGRKSLESKLSQHDKSTFCPEETTKPEPVKEFKIIHKRFIGMAKQSPLKIIRDSEESSSSNDQINLLESSPHDSNRDIHILNEQCQREPDSFCKSKQSTQPYLSSKEHRSERFNQNFATYDGITSRTRRECASFPCKRNDMPKANERMKKIRKKLNPVHDYRLLDNVHYLAQGEFAPRNDGIKLTPSREAVLSDIIWEDVCRTHWPNTRLNRRTPCPQRLNTRNELQRLIDGLLRDKVTCMERRKRNRLIAKSNMRQRNETYTSVGKTGDIIVASHKKKPEAVNEECNKNEEDQDESNSNNPAGKTAKLFNEECAPGPSQIQHRWYFENDILPDFQCSNCKGSKNQATFYCHVDTFTTRVTSNFSSMNRCCSLKEQKKIKTKRGYFTLPADLLRKIAARWRSKGRKIHKSRALNWKEPPGKC